MNNQNTKQKIIDVSEAIIALEIAHRGTYSPSDKAYKALAANHPELFNAVTGAAGGDSSILTAWGKENPDMLEFIFHEVRSAEALRSKAKVIDYSHILGIKPDHTITVPAGEYLTIDLGRCGYKVYLAGTTGIGKTTIMVNVKGPKIIVFPTLLALEQVADKNPTFGRYCHYQKDTTHETILVVYESLDRLVKKLIANGTNLANYRLVVDEAHNFSLSGYRLKALLEVDQITKNIRFKQIILMSGTPLYIPAGYELINVVSQARTQKARFVKCKGSIIAAVANNATSGNERPIIFLNNTGSNKNNMIAAVQERGFTENAIINSKEKDGDGDDMRALITTEKVSDKTQCIITTSLMLESVNVRSDFDHIHIASSLHPAHAQQLANRLRTKAADQVTIYYKNDDGKKTFDADQILAYELREANAKADRMNKETAPVIQEYMDLNFTKDCVRRDTKTKKWIADEIAAGMRVHEQYKAVAHRNPTVYKEYLRAYGWVFDGDLADSSQRTADEIELAEDMNRVDDQKYKEDLLKTFEAGEGKTEIGIKQNTLDGNMELIARRAWDISKLIPINATNWSQSFDQTLYLMAATRNNSQAIAKLKRKINYQIQLAENNPVIVSLYSEFSVGWEGTKIEKKRAFRNVLINSPSKLVQKLAFDKVTTDRITKIFNEMFVSEKMRVLRNGKRVTVSKITSHDTLQHLLDSGLEILKETKEDMKNRP